MDFLFINQQELAALIGLPYIQQITYLLGIRPYMDRGTLTVGIKRRISYQSLAETLYIEPHPGIQSGSPSRQQLRRIIKSLERAGLIQIESSETQLILKCPLANTHYSAQNKTDTKPTQQPNTKTNTKKPDNLSDDDFNQSKANTNKEDYPDIPHNSENNFVCLRKKFNEFWSTYPQPTDQEQAWQAFKKLNPDESLFASMMTALKAQIAQFEQLQKAGIWTPNWKYPANWLTQKRWTDELTTITTKERSHEKYPRHHAKNSIFETFWASCGQGAQFNLDDAESIQ